MNQVQILTQYCRFVVKLIKKAISGMTPKNIEPHKQEFLESAIATGFIRMPKFR